MRMSYRQYKQHYSDCKAHDYDASDKTIEVDIPYGRMKQSGVRGKKYDTFTFKATDGENVGEIEYKAMSRENALKQHNKYCKESGCIPVADDVSTHGVLREQLRFHFVVCKSSKKHLEMFKGFTLDEAISKCKSWCEDNGYISSYNADEAFFFGFMKMGVSQ